MSRSVAIIGSGAAGMMAALHAAQRVPVHLFTDGALGRSNTAMAQGGLQLPEDDDEAHDAFVRDMLASARANDIDLPRVHSFVRAVAPTIATLEAWGLRVDRDAEGRVIRKTAGGLSRPRIVSVGDKIGPAIVKILRQRVLDSDIVVHAKTPIVAVQPDAAGLRLTTSDHSEHRFDAVVACTGGLTYQRSVDVGHATTNPSNENHRLYAQLCELGLPRIHEDYYQYHPFGIVDPDTGTPVKCVPETIVNFDVALLDKHGREVVPMGQDRLTVVEATFATAARGEAISTADGRLGVRLTTSVVPGEVMELHFNKVQRILDKAGRLGDDLLVFPALHYHLGGFAVGPDGATNVSGLYLAGEMVGGIHGRNRLMGNGLTDSLVHGRLAGLAAADWVSRGRQRADSKT